MENARTEAEAWKSFCVMRMDEEAPQLSGSHCFGQRCMAWRWYDRLQDLGEIDRRGYCGLAGHPVKVL
jgi:hypothetical protein